MLSYKAGTAASKISLLSSHDISVSGCISSISEILPRLFIGTPIQDQRLRICLDFSLLQMTMAAGNAMLGWQA